MSDNGTIFPFSVNYGGTIGEITFTCVEDMSQFIRVGLPGILVEQAGLVDSNEALRQKLDRLKSTLKPEPKPSVMAPEFTRSKQQRRIGKVTRKIGELWDENKMRMIDDSAEFELTFPKGRYVTGFIGTMKLGPGLQPLRGSSLLWHDFFINIPENNFWKGNVVIQRRTEDEQFNIRSLGINEYVGH